MAYIQVPAQDPAIFKRWRLGMRLSQDDLATIFDRATSTISRYERGHTAIPVPVALALEALRARGVMKMGPSTVRRRYKRRRRTIRATPVENSGAIVVSDEDEEGA